MRFLTRTSQNSEGCHHVKSLRNCYNLVKALEIHVLFLITIIVATGGKLRKNQGTLQDAEVAHWVKCFLCKCEGLILNPRICI